MLCIGVQAIADALLGHSAESEVGLACLTAIVQAPLEAVEAVLPRPTLQARAVVGLSVVSPVRVALKTVQTLV